MAIGFRTTVHFFSISIWGRALFVAVLVLSVPSRSFSQAQVPPVVGAGDSRVRVDDSQVEFLYEWVIEHCYTDRIARTGYGSEWLSVRRRQPSPPPLRFEIDPSVRFPRTGRVRGSDENRRLSRELRTQWRSGIPSGHVLDCSIELPLPELHSNSQTFVFTLYLPRDLFLHPRARRALLVLFPGGRGGRSRWFLPPASSQMVRGGGGLDVPRLLDLWAERNPARSPAVVVGFDGPGERSNVQALRVLRERLNRELSQAFLPGLPTPPVGIIAISSGAAQLLIEMPRSFESLHFAASVSLYCSTRFFDPSRDWGMSVARLNLLGRLAARHRSGLLELRFDMGIRDQYTPCVRAFHRELTAAGAADPGRPPRFTLCAPEARMPNDADCVWDNGNLRVWPRAGHSYRTLQQSFPSLFADALEVLSRSSAPRPAR